MMQITTAPRAPKETKKDGFIPAVYYGAQQASTPIFIDFIEFKKFQYGRSFSLISEITPFLIFSLTILLVGLKDIIVPITGLTIYFSFIIAVIIILLRIIIIFGSANKKVIDNLRCLYNRK